MHIQFLPKHQYNKTVALGIVASILVVVVAAFLGRATLNMRAALTDKPSLALFLLLPKEEITQTTLLREKDGQSDYLVQTKDGPELVQMKKGVKEWYVSHEEILH